MSCLGANVRRLEDKANNIDVGDHTTSIAQSQLIDPKERKRQRERDRYEQMNDEQRDERNRKRREAYQKKKSDFVLQGKDKANNIDVGDHTTSIAQSQLIDPKERKRQRERDRYEQMNDEQRNERNRKRREAYQKKKKSDFVLQNKDGDITFNMKNIPCATPTSHAKNPPQRILSDE